MKKININRELFATHNLSHLFESNWYQKNVDEFLYSQCQNELFFDDEGKVTESEIIKLCKRKNYVEAAKKFKNSMLYDEEDEVIIPLHWAIEHDELELTFYLLALGEDVNGIDNYHDKYPITLAMQLKDLTIFNLLLLQPKINIYVRGAYEIENYVVHDIYGSKDYELLTVPSALLLTSQYHYCHQYLNIDWNKVKGCDDVPLMFFFADGYNIKAMSMMVAFGAEVNPILPDCYDGPRLLNYLLRKQRDYPSNDNIKVIEWYGKFTSILSDSDWEEISTISDEIIIDSPEFIDDFGIGFYKEIKEELEDIKGEFDAFQRVLLSNPHRNVPYENKPYYQAKDIKVSLFDDLKESYKVEFRENVIDFVYERIDCRHWFSVFYKNRPYPISYEFDKELINRVRYDGMELLTSTSYQSLFLFMKMRVGFYLNIEEVFNIDNHFIFNVVDDNFIFTWQEYELLCLMLNYQDLYIGSDVVLEFLKLFDSINVYHKKYSRWVEKDFNKYKIESLIMDCKREFNFQFFISGDFNEYYLYFYGNNNERLIYKSKLIGNIVKHLIKNLNMFSKYELLDSVSDINEIVYLSE